MRRIRITAASAVVLALTAPAGAFAATTIGSNLAGSPGSSISCNPDPCTFAHSVLPLSSQAPGGVLAPNDGVVVRWRIKVGAATAPVALRITRPGDNDTRTGAGTGPTVTPPINNTTPYDVRLPIQAGDALGVTCCGNPDFANFFAMTATVVTRLWSPPLVDGEAARMSGSVSPIELLINADIEADADHDGYGDETQDQCPTNAAVQGPCPTTTAAPTAAPTGQRDAALKKCKKKYKKNHNQKTFKKCKKKAKLLPV